MKTSTLPKAPTGIQGLDDITFGGLPRGRPTLVCGGAGSGKTMLAAEFIVRGAADFDEPGVFMMFEESAAELTENVRSLGFDLDELCAQGRVALDHVHVERSEIEETGEYDLEGLFIRLGHAIERVGAQRVVLDTLEALYAGLADHAVLRGELRRLFRWLKERGMTAIVTAERGSTGLTRYGLEEYVADCVLLLDHRVDEQVSTRRLRVVKYRGSPHGTNEYPFMIGDRGISVLPVTSLKLDHPAPEERVGIGISGLDAMLCGGIYRGSSVLLTGTPGTGKSSIAIAFADAACARGERTLVFVHEESPDQLRRNMRSIGLDLARRERDGLLSIHATRPTLYGLEQHLVHVFDLVRDAQPAVVVIDPISHLSLERADYAVKPALMRLVDFLKQCGATALYTSLTSRESESALPGELGVSSLMDTWIQLANVDRDGHRGARTVRVLKSRGMPHANQSRELVFTGEGMRVMEGPS